MTELIDFLADGTQALGRWCESSPWNVIAVIYTALALAAFTARFWRQPFLIGFRTFPLVGRAFAQTALLASLIYATILLIGGFGALLYWATDGAAFPLPLGRGGFGALPDPPSPLPVILAKLSIGVATFAVMFSMGMLAMTVAGDDANEATGETR